MRHHGQALALTACAAWLGAGADAAGQTAVRTEGAQTTETARPSQEATPAQDAAGALAGFDNETFEEKREPSTTRSSRLRLGGRLKLGAAYNFAHDAPGEGETDWRGLSRLRPELRLEAAADLGDSWRLFASGQGGFDLAYPIRGEGHFTSQVLDRYEQDLELWDTYVAGHLGPQVDLKIGRQIVAWGTSETVRVTDVINPLDLREPGLTDIDDLRLPVAMTRVDVGAGRWRLTGIAIHERRFNRAPAPGHDFFPPGPPLPVESRPAATRANTELAAAAQGFFRGWDLSLYWARVFDDSPHVALATPARPELRHSRVSMLGAAWVLAAGDLLVKSEAAHLRGLRFFNDPDRTFSRTDLMAGLEYSGLSEATITLEVVGRRLHGFRSELERIPDRARESEIDWVLRLSRAFRHQTLAVSLIAVTFGLTGDDGALQRLECRYDVNDALEITSGIVLYASGDRPGFETIGSNDRLFLDIEYRF